MSAQTASHSPEFTAIILQVETALTQAAADARELAERTGTPLVVRERGGIEPMTKQGATSAGKEELAYMQKMFQI